MTYMPHKPCLSVLSMALSWKGKSGWHLHYLITGCPFHSKLCETQKNKGEMSYLAVVETIRKKLDCGSWNPCDFDQIYSKCLFSPLSSEGLD